MQPMSDQTRDHRTATLMQLLDDLESAVASARKFPGLGRVTVDGQHIVNLIDEMRVSLPVEFQQASRIIQERQRIIIDAQEEAGKIVDAAKERASYLVSEAGVLSEARQQGEKWLREADQDAERTVTGANRFALSVVDDIESNLREQLRELELARVTLENRHRTQV